MRLFGQEIVLGEKIEKLNCVDISKIAISKNGEVIKKEDADKSDEREAYIKKLVQSNIDQQNKIALLSAKVYKLQKENAKVEEIKTNADYQLEGRDLEIMEQKEQLTKAKEIIKNLKALYLSPVVTKDDVKRQDEILNEAEQFLSEVEK